ncbi:unnamed protein product [Parascedosporium putredinis]|uniref:Heterokaryon incompatibility domain-containing protein n=1 Tax=Parascedosporium putredinis TaxID=1442378 RepID=A0A9P1GZ36_9PEZI|nr:unnamed protein product [Parascedosporium putredinis]CAI7992430.1 unnamed protein product [Parascedosporium putredinis]
MSSESLLEQLCAPCAEINLRFQDKPEWQDGPIREYSNPEELGDAAARACPMCIAIAMSHDATHDFYRVGAYDSHSAIKVFHALQKDELESNIFWECQSRVAGKADQNKPGKSSSISSSLGGFFASEEPDSAKLPTRVIDVCLDGSGPPFLHISLDEEDEPDARYVALSYCWGGPQADCLTNENIDDKCKDIRLQNLGKTIQDAIEITRKLGIRFIWVDSQCIIQDSRTDWQIESSRMGSIYHNAEITLQASRAPNSNAGCLLPRKLPTSPRSHFDSQASPDPLDDRGWTLQEGLLARRIISLKSRHITWECGLAFKSESGAPLHSQGSFLGLPKPILTRRKNDQVAEALSNQLGERLQPVLTWEFIVREFTNRRLSFPTDKLPAIAGIARHLEKTRPGDSYLAGMWKSDMPWSLLWGPDQSSTRPAEYRAPSWSWASLDGSISCFGDTMGWWDEEPQAHCVVEDASVTPKGLDEFGEVFDGYLTVRGALKEAWWMACPGHHDIKDKLVYIFEEPKVPDPTDHVFSRKLGLLALDLQEPDMQWNTPVPVWCLRVTATDAVALVKKKEGTYRRVGICCVDDHKTSWFEGTHPTQITVV